MLTKRNYDKHNIMLKIHQAIKLTKKNSSILSLTSKLDLNPHLIYNTIHFATDRGAGDIFFRPSKEELVSSSTICQLKERKENSNKIIYWTRSVQQVEFVAILMDIQHTING